MRGSFWGGPEKDGAQTAFEEGPDSDASAKPFIPASLETPEDEAPHHVMGEEIAETGCPPAARDGVPEDGMPEALKEPRANITYDPRQEPYTRPVHERTIVASKSRDYAVYNPSTNELEF